MFYCNFCSHESKSLNEHINHHKFHRNIVKFFHCGFDRCKYIFGNKAYLSTHLIRKHGIRSKKEMVAYSNFPANNKGKYICTVEICQKEFDNFSCLLKHMKGHIHNKQEIKCPYSGCEKKYSIISSFTSHLTKVHKTVYHQSKTVSNENSISFEDNNVEVLFENRFVDNVPINLKLMENENELDVPNAANNQSDLFLKNLAQFYLKLECQFHLPASTVQYIISELNNIRDLAQTSKKEKLKEVLLNKDISLETVDEIVEQILSDDLMTNSNKIFDSNYKRKQYYKKEFKYVDPVSIEIDKNKHFSYVPPAKTLENMFFDKSIQNHLNFNISEKKSDGLLEDFTDGSVYKNNSFFKQNPTALKIILYQDSFEVVNPIGAARKKHKILAIYMNLGNISDHLRGHVDTIKLVALCKEVDFDHSKVYGKLVSDLQKIETDGITINGTNFKGSVVYIAGDNLGSHSLGGFLENFSKATYFCRFCSITRETFHSENGCFTIGELRTVDSYEKSVQNIGNHDSNNGIKFNSVFNQLQHYHVCSPGLPPCLGHDLFEGIVAYDMKLFVDYFIANKWFSLKYLNKKIDDFKYSSEDRRDKPCLIKDSDRIVGGACQIWTFLRVFPFLIEDKVKDVDDDVWNLIMLLSEIVEIICSPSIHLSTLPYLELLIAEYILKRKLVFPLNNLRPKHHYILHYPMLISQFGPLIKVWTLRYESKHRFFKKTVRFLNNFINLTKTLSVKHELLQSLVRLGSDIRMEIDTNAINHFDLKLYNISIQEAIIKRKLVNDLQQCNKVIYKGTEYKKGYVLALRQNGYRDNIVFGKICFFIYHDSNIFVLFEILENQFLPYFGAYEIGKTVSYECHHLHDIVDYKPLYIYNTGQNLYIKPFHGFVSHHI